MSVYIVYRKDFNSSLPMVLPTAAYTQAFVTVILLYSSKKLQGKDVEGFQGGELSKADQDKLCFNFTEGSPERKEIYSPNFPNNYPNNTKCEVQLKAPHGHIIQLDFRETFHLEESPVCEYDWLEIRNGPHGYSTLIDKYCGDKFPPKLKSQDRYLWLKFSSDDSIEYPGFKAIYEFVKSEDSERPQAEDCTFEKGGPGGLVSPSDISKAAINYSLIWNVPLDCTWKIEVAEGWKMYVNFQKYKLRHPNNCDLNFIDIYQGALSYENMMAQFCGTATEPQKSEGNKVFVRYFAKPEAVEGRFQIVYTAFREISPTDKCLTSEFSCDDGTCIDRSLKCNKLFNCKYRYDEDPALCTPALTASKMLTSEHMITILIVFFVLLTSMCASIVITCYNKVKDRQEKKREYKLRRSKEVSVEGEMDRVLANMDPGLEAALAAQAAEIGAARRKIQMPSWADQEDSNGCYVPEVDLTIFQKSPNGGHVISREMNGDRNIAGIHIISNSFSDGINPFCKEHGDSRRRVDGSLSPPLPPPPPPPMQHRRLVEDSPTQAENELPHSDNLICQKHNRLTSYHQRSQYLQDESPSATSAGVLGDEEEVDEVEDLNEEEGDAVPFPLPPSSRYRADMSVVESSTSSNTRPRSFDSTNLAPDVIVHR